MTATEINLETRLPYAKFDHSDTRIRQASIPLSTEGRRMNYLATATNFTDMEVRQPPTGYPCKAEEATICPKCKGYGGWVLTVNAYPLPKGMEDTPENRAKYRHFRAHCNQCNGWGWVKRDSRDATCVHDYKELTVEQSRARGIAHHGMCWHVYECVKCEQIRTTDSSD